MHTLSTKTAPPAVDAAPLDLRLLAGSAASAARALIGKYLLSRGPSGISGGVVVEAEAYDQADPASHSCRGPTQRTRAMFGPAGHAYVYRSYGLHWCLNVSCGPVGHGSAVLIRALRPLWGASLMARRRLDTAPTYFRDRGHRPPADGWLCSGPGKLTQALAVTGDDDGLFLNGAERLQLLAPADGGGPPAIVAGPRVGIRLAREIPWRFALAGCRYVSLPRPRPPG